MNSMVLNQSIGIASVILSVLGILQLSVGAKVDRRTKRYFLFFYVLLILFAGSNLAGQRMRGLPGAGYHTALVISNFCEFLFSGLLAFIGGRYILSMVDAERELRAERSLLTALMAVHTILLVVSQFTGLLYSIDAQNVYHRAALYPMSLVCPGGMLLLGAWVLLRRRSRLTPREQLAFLLFMTVPLAAMAVQAFVYGIYLVVLSTTVSLLVMFLFLATEQTERFYRQAEENTRLKVDLMLSQIQPHFLYNSLSVIQEIVRTDPGTAEQAIGQFARFLRHNMRSINSDQPILFRQELEHARSYLSLQSLRFGDELRVVYDLECEDFLLPTLTLQPIVENAVSHGIRESESGIGTVTIRTRELDDRYEIQVVDDGAGFDLSVLEAGGEAGIGIRNVRDRLKRVSGGRLELRSQPGNGTTATIILPKEGS